MTNEKYTGEFKFGGRDCKNIYPAIVDKALFLKVQEKLAENKYVLGGQETAKVPYLLSGKVFCDIAARKWLRIKVPIKAVKNIPIILARKDKSTSAINCVKIRTISKVTLHLV